MRTSTRTSGMQLSTNTGIRLRNAMATKPRARKNYDERKLPRIIFFALRYRVQQRSIVQRAVL